MTAPAQPLHRSGFRSSAAPAVPVADPDHADLDHADPDHADLDHADLDHADLDHADLDHADLGVGGPDVAARRAAEPDRVGPDRTEPRPDPVPSEPDPTDPAFGYPEFADPVAPRAVPSRLTSRAPRAPFVVLLLVLLGGGLLCLLLLNTALTERAFQVHELQAESERLAEQEQALVLEVDKLSNPAALATQAADLGMGPGQPPTLLPAGEPLPSGARIVATEPATGALLVVVAPPPATGSPAPGAPAAPEAAEPEGAEAPGEATAPTDRGGGVGAGAAQGGAP